MQTIRALGGLVAALLIAAAGYGLCHWMHGDRRSADLSERDRSGRGLDSLFAAAEGGHAARGSSAPLRRLTPPDTVRVVVPQTRTIYRTRTDTVTQVLRVPQGFETHGVIGRRPVSRTAAGGFTLTYFEPSAGRYQQDTYAPPEPPRWALWPELGAGYVHAAAGPLKTGALSIEALVSLRRGRASLDAGGRVLAVGGEVYAGPAVGLRWRPFGSHTW